MIGAEHCHDLVLRNEPQRLVLPDRWIALMVGADELDLRPSKIGKPCALGERQTFQFGMCVVHDLEAKLDSILGGIARGRGITGERIDNADLDGVGGVARQCKAPGKQRRSQKRFPHAVLPCDGGLYRPVERMLTRESAVA